jgi:hypothetical protein
MTTSCLFFDIRPHFRKLLSSCGVFLPTSRMFSYWRECSALVSRLPYHLFAQIPPLLIPSQSAFISSGLYKNALLASRTSKCSEHYKSKVTQLLLCNSISSVQIIRTTKNKLNFIIKVPMATADTIW